MGADTEPGNFLAGSGYIPRFIGFDNLISRGVFYERNGQADENF